MADAAVSPQLMLIQIMSQSLSRARAELVQCQTDIETNEELVRKALCRPRNADTAAVLEEVLKQVGELRALEDKCGQRVAECTRQLASEVAGVRGWPLGSASQARLR